MHAVGCRHQLRHVRIDTGFAPVLQVYIFVWIALAGSLNGLYMSFYPRELFHSGTVLCRLTRLCLLTRSRAYGSITCPVISDDVFACPVPLGTDGGGFDTVKQWQRREL